jgi:hypothetical protein
MKNKKIGSYHYSAFCRPPLTSIKIGENTNPMEPAHRPTQRYPRHHFHKTPTEYLNVSGNSKGLKT